MAIFSPFLSRIDKGNILHNVIKSFLKKIYLSEISRTRRYIEYNAHSQIWCQKFMKNKDECVCESCSKKSRWLFQIMSKNIEFQYKYSHATIQMRSQTRLYPNQQVLAVERWNAPPQYVTNQIVPTLFPPKIHQYFFFSILLHFHWRLSHFL